MQSHEIFRRDLTLNRDHDHRKFIKAVVDPMQI
jgi:hypothetical protein